MAVPGTCFYEYRQAASTSPPRGHPGLEHLLSISPPLLRRSSSRSLLLLCSALLQLDASPLDARCPAGASIPVSCSNDCIALCSTGPSQPSAICCESLRQRRLPSALLWPRRDDETTDWAGPDCFLCIAIDACPTQPVAVKPARLQHSGPRRFADETSDTAPPASSRTYTNPTCIYIHI